MAFRGRKVLKEDGTWEDRPAKPEALPEHLRSLPGDLVTKDEADEDKIHQEDAPHIVEALKYEADKREHEATREPTAKEHAAAVVQDAPLGEVVPLSQQRVDVVRFRIIRSLLAWFVDVLERGDNLILDQVHHVWFPSNNVNEYLLRRGKAPPEADRPEHLRRLRLEIDIMDPPQSIVDAFEAAGRFRYMDIVRVYQKERESKSDATAMLQDEMSRYH